MASKQFAHEPFACLVCRRWIAALQQHPDSPDEAAESYMLCEGCGAVYLIMSKLCEVRDIAKLSPHLTWRLVPDSLTPGPLKDVQAEIRSRSEYRAARGQA